MIGSTVEIVELELPYDRVQGLPARRSSFPTFFQVS